MRKFVVIFLFLVLPIQFSWSAVAGYCQHESAVDSGHFGHHEHRHVEAAGSAANAATDPAVEQAALVVDLDCGQCHGQCSAMALVAALMLDQRVGGALVGGNDEAIATPARARPERPKWLRLA